MLQHIQQILQKYPKSCNNVLSVTVFTIHHLLYYFINQRYFTHATETAVLGQTKLNLLPCRRGLLEKLISLSAVQNFASFLQPILKEFSRTLASQDDWHQWQCNATFSCSDVSDLCPGKGEATIFLLIYLYITLNGCLEDKIKINNCQVWLNSVDTKKSFSFTKFPSRAVIYKTGLGMNARVFQSYRWNFSSSLNWILNGH